MTGARHITFIAYWRLGMGIVDMDASQAEFLFQIKMSVHGNSVAIIVAQQCQQPLRIHRRGAWFIEVQVLQALLKEVGKYFVFFHEKGGFGHYDELHFPVSLLFPMCKLTHFFRYWHDFR